VYIIEAVPLWPLEVWGIEQFRLISSRRTSHVFAPTLYLICLEWYLEAWRLGCKCTAFSS
jgi:hypothetical protein